MTVSSERPPIFAPISMTPAEVGWVVPSVEGVDLPVIGWSVLRDFANPKAENIFGIVAMEDGTPVDVDGRAVYNPYRYERALTRR